MVYRCASTSLSEHVGLRLERRGSLSGLCVEQAQVLRCDDSESDARVNKAACRRVGVRSMLCTDSPPEPVQQRAAAVIVKTRMPEGRIVETIARLLRRGEPQLALR